MGTYFHSYSESTGLQRRQLDILEFLKHRASSCIHSEIMAGTGYTYYEIRNSLVELNSTSQVKAQKSRGKVTSYSITPKGLKALEASKTAKKLFQPSRFAEVTHYKVDPDDLIYALELGSVDRLIEQEKAKVSKAYQHVD